MASCRARCAKVSCTSRAHVCRKFCALEAPPANSKLLALFCNFNCKVAESQIRSMYYSLQFETNFDIMTLLIHAGCD
jgi:hypothetical protein